MPIEKDGMRTQLRGSAQRHRGMYAEFSRLVARGSYDAALIALPSHDHSLRTQFRTYQQLYRNEKRVHINVQDGGGAVRCDLERRIVLRAVLCQLGHGGDAQLKSLRVWGGQECFAEASGRIRPRARAGYRRGPS